MTDGEAAAAIALRAGASTSRTREAARRCTTKILAGDGVHIGDFASLAIAGRLATGIVLSLAADRLDLPRQAEEATRHPPRLPEATHVARRGTDQGLGATGRPKSAAAVALSSRS